MFGSGCSEGVPVPGCTCPGCRLGIRRRRTGYVVESRHTSLWLDIGPDFREQLLEYGRLPDAIFISHKHFDHIGGLSDLRQMLIVSGGGGYRPRILIPKNMHRVLLADHSHLETSIGAYKDIVRTSAADIILLREDRAVVLNDMVLHVFFLKHGKILSAGLYVETDDASLLYLADAEEISEELLDFVSARGGVDLVLFHAPYLEDMDGHMSVADALRIPARFYVVSHISHLVNRAPADLDAYLAEKYGNNVVSAFDGMWVTMKQHRIVEEELKRIPAYITE